MPPSVPFRTYLELQPLVPLDRWWQIGLLVIGIALLLATAAWIVRRDSHKLSAPLTWLITGLRLSALVFLVVFLLGPGLRSESRIQSPSKLAILVDTSLSMGLRDSGKLSDGGPRRIEQVIAWLDSNQQIESLRKRHTLLIYRFGASNQPELIAELPKRTEEIPGMTSELLGIAKGSGFRLAVAAWAAGIAFVALLLVFMTLFYIAWSTIFVRSAYLAASIAALMLCLILTGLTDLSLPETSIVSTLSFRDDPAVFIASTEMTQETELVDLKIDWSNELVPSATATAAGSSIQWLVNKERGSTLAAIVVLTDGQSNEGVSLEAAASVASSANIPIFPVGIGDTGSRSNLEIADLQAPARVMPNDQFKLKAIIKSTGFRANTVGLTIYSTDEQGDDKRIETEAAIQLGGDGELIPFETELESQQVGRRVYLLELEIPKQDINPADNQRSVTVEAIQRKNKILLVAGGPNREFRFLRNQLYRDEEVVSHVFLQSAKQGADQEADSLLTEFPSSEEDMFSYDCLIAFDPDWRQLSQRQCDLLERWVAEKSGGLILVAGPVNTPEWTRRPRGDESIDIIRQLYPVSFFNQGTAQLKLGRFGGTQPFPLDFTREGRAARYLWLGESSLESASIWNRFEGIFGYYAVNESKAGADVLASFSDNSTAIDGQLPIYLSSQFYGSGRVFFQASAEMWRVRHLKVEYFQEYYDRLIRWTSQGRLLRDSNRGVLIVERDRCWMGDQVPVRAILRDEADEPLMAESVTATVLRPDGSRKILELQSTGGASRPGTFSTVINTPLEGEYRISLPVPSSVELDVLTKSVFAAIPDQEKAKPQRNDAALSELASKTQGQYYAGMESFEVDDDNPLSPVSLIVPQDQETFLTGTLNPSFRKKLLIWLLVWIVTSLSLEWTIRRLHKLS